MLYDQSVWGRTNEGEALDKGSSVTLGDPIACAYVPVPIALLWSFRFRFLLAGSINVILKPLLEEEKHHWELNLRLGEEECMTDLEWLSYAMEELQKLCSYHARKKETHFNSDRSFCSYSTKAAISSDVVSCKCGADLIPEISKRTGESLAGLTTQQSSTTR